MSQRSTGDLLVRGVKYPASDDDWLRTLLVGGALFLFGFLVVPALAGFGFLVQVVREGLAEDDDIPEFEDFGWETLVGDGLRVVGISLAYWLALFAVLLALSFVAGFQSALVGTSVDAATNGVLVVWAVLLLVAAWVLPAAIVNFARHGSMRAAFDADLLVAVGTSPEYLVGWLYAIGVAVVQTVLSVALTLTGVGIVLLPWLNFYLAASVAYIFGRSCARAAGFDPLDWGPEADDPRHGLAGD